jgi:hypothetical protein
MYRRGMVFPECSIETAQGVKVADLNLGTLRISASAR